MSKIVLLLLLGIICAINAQLDSGVENPIEIIPTTTTTTTLKPTIHGKPDGNANENDEDRSDAENPSDTTVSETTLTTVDDVSNSTNIPTDDDGSTNSTIDDLTKITPEDEDTTTTEEKPPNCPQAGFFPFQTCEDYLYCVVIDNKMTGLKFSCPPGMQYNPGLGFCDATYDCNTV